MGHGSSGLWGKWLLVVNCSANKLVSPIILSRISFPRNNYTKSTGSFHDIKCAARCPAECFTIGAGGSQAGCSVIAWAGLGLWETGGWQTVARTTTNSKFIISKSNNSTNSILIITNNQNPDHYLHHSKTSLVLHHSILFPLISLFAFFSKLSSNLIKKQSNKQQYPVTSFFQFQRSLIELEVTRTGPAMTKLSFPTANEM